VRIRFFDETHHRQRRYECRLMAHPVISVRRGRWSLSAQPASIEPRRSNSVCEHAPRSARGSIARKLEQSTRWQIELLDQAGKPIARVSPVAETLDKQSCWSCGKM